MKREHACGGSTAPNGARSDTELLERFLPSLRYIWLRRHDTLRQAVSWWRDRETAFEPTRRACPDSEVDDTLVDASDHPADEPPCFLGEFLSASV